MNGMKWARAGMTRALAASAVCLGLNASRAQPVNGPAAEELTTNLSLRLEVERAVAKGVEWLVKNQEPKGHWSTEEHPAVTALALFALQGAPIKRASGSEALSKGYAYLLRCVQPDGGIHQGALQNYNTSLGVMALVAAGNPDYRPVIDRARKFIIGLQGDFGVQGELDHPSDGGIGYGQEKHADLSNTLLALEALYYSKGAGDTGGKPEDLNWAAAIHFIQNCQNLPAHNRQPWASDDPAYRGGFAYSPSESKAGEVTLPSGRVALRSYGSMSYAGLLSYIYAELDRDDPRVQAVISWLRNNYTLEENPGVGPQGLFYYYQTMAKALTAYGVEVLATAEGAKVDWREELALRMINLQNADGSWANTNGRWWEKDPALVTSYGLITLELIHRGL